jgi:hypothetical protein
MINGRKPSMVVDTDSRIGLKRLTAELTTAS